MCKSDPEMPALGVAAMLWRGNHILMGKRLGAHGAGSWSFPGGHMEAGETPQQTASRETEEETGQLVPPDRFVPVAFTYDVFDSERVYITLFLEARAPSDRPRVLEPSRCAGWQWVKPGYWPGELFLPIRNLIAQGYSFVARCPP